MEINKKNFKKVLRELKLEEHLTLDDKLISIREKLINKVPLSISDEVLGFNRLKKYFDEFKAAEIKYISNSVDFSFFKARPLLNFQEDGTKFLIDRENAILADDTGLGKSIQSIAASLLLPEDYKILIVTLKSLKYNFLNEIEFYTKSAIVIDKKWESGYKFTIVHYDSLKKWENQIKKEKFNVIIADEATTLKNSTSVRSEIFKKISKNVKRIWLLTGTPMANRPYDYYNLLKIIKHPITKNWEEFVVNYCDGKKVMGFWDKNGASNLLQLHEATKDNVLRRLKKDYLSDLPQKYRSEIYLKLENKKQYNKVVEDWQEKKAKLLEEEGISVNAEDINVQMMTEIILYRQFCALEKINDGSIIDFISEKLNEDSSNKIVFFSNFTSVLDAVKLRFKEKCVIVDGRIKDAKERLNIISTFNESSTQRIIALNTMVGSMGFNIQSANIGIINDMYWVPGIMVQCEDRMWRIGQKRNVNIYYPIYKDTFEEVIYNVINSKMRNISTAIEGKEEAYFEEISGVDNNIFKEIIRNLDSLK